MREALRIEELRGIYARIARRYDFRHGLITAGTDQRGRRLLVESSVREADRVLDCGTGTGTTGILAAELVGPSGEVVLFDLSDAMLDVARQKAAVKGLQARVTFETGDMVQLPFDDDEFDVVLSTYSICPLYDPEQGALEMYRVTRPGGRIGVVHSIEPTNRIVKWLSNRVEGWAWHFPSLSMGCRPVKVLPAFENAGGKILFSRVIGFPLWPFFVFVIGKPTA